MNSNHCLLVALLLGMIGLCPLPASAGDAMKSKSLPPIPLSVEEVQAWIDRTHPLLRGAGTEKVMARGKMLKALGAFEPTLINATEIERFIKLQTQAKAPKQGASTTRSSKPAIPGDSATARGSRASDRRCNYS